MNHLSRWAKVVAIVGIVLFLAGIIDPLEGSVLIAAGSVVITAAMYLGGAERKAVLYWTWVCIAILVGVAALFGFSAVGGFGGRSGRSPWWALTLLPYPLAWLAGVRWLILELIRSRRLRNPSISAS